MSPLHLLWAPINLSALNKTSQTEMKCVSLHTSEAKPPTGQPSDLIQLSFLPRYLPLWSHRCCCGVESSAIQGAFISSCWGQYLAWSRPFFICTKRSPFLTHSALMAPFTPLSAPSPGSTMSASLSPRFAHADFYPTKKLVVRREPFVTNLQGGGMARSFKLYLAIFSPSHTGDFSLSHFSGVTKVIQCLCHWTRCSFLQK